MPRKNKRAGKRASLARLSKKQHVSFEEAKRFQDVKRAIPAQDNKEKPPMVNG